MLDEKEIQSALHAERVVPLSVSTPHGPFGLEQVAAAVAQITDSVKMQNGRVSRPISLPIETWAKLDGIADQLSSTKSHHVSASEVATALVMNALERQTES